ncbi:unnamed protein product [Oreochromis niloticus]|nr:unnamed protein product [Mustela putorius furo]
MAKVAKEVVHLFTAGSRNNQNTVLLLVDDKKILEDLQSSIMMTVAEQKIVTRSYLLESQCLDFLRHEDYDDLSLEDQMQPFSHLIITFQQDGRAEAPPKMG